MNSNRRGIVRSLNVPPSGEIAIWDASSLSSDLFANAITTSGTVTTSTSIYTLGTQSVLFDAAGELLTWPISTAPGTQDFFIGVWARWARYGAGSTCFITGFGNGNAANTIMVGVRNPSYSSSGLSLFVASNYNSYATNVIPAENTWHHVALSKSGTTYRVFLNGIVQGTWTITGLNLGSPFRIGSGWTSNGEQLNGYVNSAQVVIGNAVVTSSFAMVSPNYRYYSTVSTPGILNIHDLPFIG